jgi:peptidoglycan L-alanyl-D-glutamate endopeptidase CwlK
MTLAFDPHNRLAGVHPDLIRVVTRAAALTTQPFEVICGLRTVQQEQANVAKGASETMHSRHLNGCAVDVAALEGGCINWAAQAYTPIADAFEQASKDLGIPITWGGSWTTLKDYGHFELSWSAYPSTAYPYPSSTSDAAAAA